jgi:alanine dehydrogenase
VTETLLLTRRDVAELVSMADCIEAVEDAFRAQAEGRTLPSAVLALHAPAGTFHVKAGGLQHGRLQVAAKINANFPGNPAAHGLPTIQGLIVLCDGDDGQPLAVMDSMEITALRTGAATAVAAKYLARPESSTLALFGCGKQALYQLRALAAVLPIKTILVYDRDPERAAAFESSLSAEASLAIRCVEDPRSALRDADVVVTCTPSKQAFVGPRDVRPGAFVAGVGADNPEKHELEPSLLAISRVVVDSLEQAATIGDLHHALTAGAVRREDVHAELWEIVAGQKPGRLAPDEITVFDSTGIAIEDVATAALVYERAVASGRGQRLDFSA